MFRKFYDLTKLIAFRHDMHQQFKIYIIYKIRYPESSFKEFNTQRKIKEYLLSIDVHFRNIIYFKIEESVIKPCASTGLVVDLIGKAPEVGVAKSIAFRADIDALVMNEANEDLPYRSTNGCAHMCGHDGHTTCLLGIKNIITLDILGFASLFQEQIHEIPKNKRIRLLFQPAEEDIGGAIEMIKEGCLDGIDEVYGFHQMPYGKIGQVWVKPGPMMSEPFIFDIQIIGKGGHASQPKLCKNPTLAGVEFISTIEKRLGEIQESGKKFTFCFPYFKAGTVVNIIPDMAYIKGMVRNLEEGFGDTAVKIVSETLNEVAAKHGCTANLFQEGQNYTLTSNSELEAAHILRLGKQFFGENNAGQGICPVYASEDFGQFTKVKPGAFFFLSSGKNETGNPILHQSNLNFNDDLIDLGSRFWLLIALDRLTNN